MPPPTIERRLPCYEGHLILNHAILSDAPQTSNGTAWSERWCSLEDGKLLVYTDRTAAMIDPEDTCAVIDVHSFVCVQPSTATSEHAYELVLSHSLPETTKASRLFRPKSAMSLNRLQAESVSRQDYMELEPRPSMASVSRMSIQSRPLNSIELASISANTETGDLAANPTTKSWSKFGFGSRRLYAKLSSSSNGSLRINHNLPTHSGSATSSIISSIDARASTDIASSGAPSPRTPHSATFSAAPENVPVRATSASSYSSWLDALSLTIKMHNETPLAPSPMIKQHSRGPTRPSLSNLPGFRTPTILQAGPVFPSTESCGDPAAQDVTPKATRQRHSSTASLSFALTASRQMQDKTFDRAGGSGSDKHTTTSVATGEHISFNEPRKRRPSTADAFSSAASQIFGTKDGKATQQQRKHERSISTASSSLSSGRLSDQRRNSVSGTQLLASGSQTLSPAQHVETSVEGSAVLPAQASIGKKFDVQKAVEPASDNAQPAARHRRSGSLMKFGSARILAWRDTFTAVDPSATTSDTLTGLGLQVDQGDSSVISQADCSEKVKATRGLSGFKSLRSLTKSRSNIKEPNTSSNDRRAESVSSASPSVAGDSETALAESKAASQPKSKGMSRSTSLLSITKNTFASLRERSSSRQNVRTVFAAPQEDAAVADQTQDSGRVQTADCDFSYELVEETRDAGASEVDNSDSTLVGNATPSIDVADDSRAESAFDDQRAVDADNSIAEKLAALHLRPSSATGSDNTSSPSLPSERILPPKQIIDTFDKLRAADPTGRSCDWLRQIEASGRRGSLDWAAATCGVRRPSLRAAASQTFASRGASMDLLRSTPRLRSSMSAWDLGAAPGVGEKVEGGVEVEAQPATERISGDGVDGVGSRSLPAPPRASKRRARVSSSQPSRPSPASNHAPKKPFGDLTNSHNGVKRRSSSKIDTDADVMGLTPAPRSPRRLGSRKRSVGRVVG